MSQNKSAFSAPGKALVAGGYLVLDPAYNSYVTALSSRMHAVVGESPNSGANTVRFTSRQFEDGEWNYEVKQHPEMVVTEAHGKKNPFLEAAVKTVVCYFQPSQFSLQVDLFSDKEYHSQENTRKIASTNGASSFLVHKLPIQDVPKTGLGSSAGLVTVVTAALYSRFCNSDANTFSIEKSRETIHNLAQMAHCLAQGKIGSGFDVAAATFGSIIYRRFAPSTIDAVLGSENAELVRTVANSKWNMRAESCSLPNDICLVLGDVQGGSETPKLVSKVLQWWRSDPASAAVISALNAANELLMASLADAGAAKRQATASLTTLLKNIRSGLKTLTEKTGAEIEPDEQTRILDLCETLPGCLGGVVPGAGGYDAICLLVERAKVCEFKRASTSVAGLLAVTWLDLHEEATGLRQENAADYEGL